MRENAQRPAIASIHGAQRLVVVSRKLPPPQSSTHPRWFGIDRLQTVGAINFFPKFDSRSKALLNADMLLMTTLKLFA
ncbi:hypothetical protein [Bradyrhizobium sp. sBnM-33]|uniref:hypothetical protein n=1 Tax=Bradyrhizobium sp. sBnM-33 TaxID=2831780 RepID=UPI001BCBCDC8|nr:hypothetical protein [Bradyrhizobium sp. sBnM-33]WOH52466.1 hypothetical protein RX328_09965 [Bradyrhizobium sp. sBnM-33]